GEVNAALTLLAHSDQSRKQPILLEYYKSQEYCFRDATAVCERLRDFKTLLGSFGQHYLPPKFKNLLKSRLHATRDPA
ncbi:MAG TPA: hypothetical protein VMC08_04770, partial [Bacteroidales bacterium]|nr:hypothetical protein [Bacteroidales bacterium]